MDTISHSEASLLGKFYVYQENNAPFMTKIVNFAFFPWTLLGHSKKNTNVKGSICIKMLIRCIRVTH